MLNYSDCKDDEMATTIADFTLKRIGLSKLVLHETTCFNHVPSGAQTATGSAPVGAAQSGPVCVVG